MDTSEFRIASELLGQCKIHNVDIPPKVWLHLIEQVYRSDRLGAERCLFRRFADWADGPGMVRIPRGVTFFEKGLGVNTVVRMVPVDKIQSGENFGNKGSRWSHTEEQFLLLLKREEWNMPLRWAAWRVDYDTTLNVAQVYVNTITFSQVCYVSQAGAAEIFRRHPMAAYNLLAVWPEVDVQVRKLLDEIYKLTRSAEWLRGVIARIMA